VRPDPITPFPDGALSAHRTDDRLPFAFSLVLEYPSMSTLARPFAPFVAALVAAAVAAGGVLAQDVPIVEPVSFSTVDGVTLRGKFYKGPKSAPVVILLHNVGGSETSSHPNWIALAKELQSDFAVLAFDFRGHGNSTSVDPLLFYRNVADKRAVPGLTAEKTQLDIKAHNKTMYQLLCNDIAAAKSYLERTKNDQLECNTQNMFLIGAEQGATLGAIWANSEYYRYKCDMTPTGLPRYAGSPEGKYFTGFMWLSIAPKVGDKPINVAALAAMPAKNNAAVFCLYGGGDKKAADLAKIIEKTAHAVKKSERPVAVPVDKADKAVGVELLSSSLTTLKDVHAQLKTLAASVNDREWEKREFTKTLSAWKIPGVNQPIHARANFPTGGGTIGIGIVAPPTPTAPVPDVIEKNILFNDYDRFIPR
jgi:hypothetical protein